MVRSAGLEGRTPGLQRIMRLYPAYTGMAKDEPGTHSPTALTLTVRVDTEDGLPLFNLFGRASMPEFVIFKAGIAACHPVLHTPDSIRDYRAKGVPLFNSGAMRVLLQASDDG